MAGIALDHLSKSFEGDVPAVRDVTLRIPDGDLTVLVGPSGCGKTTVLRMIAGLETPTSGSITIGARDVTDLPPRDRDVAMVFQNYALYPHLTVRENIAFPLEMRSVPSRDISGRVNAAAESLGIGALMARRPSQLSGGQRQRVALARAIVREPQVFLFDEPLSNLDAQVRAQTRAELVNLQRRLGATMLYVTHDQVEAMTMASGVAVMQQGQVEQFGAPLDIYRTPASLVVASFVGSPSINRFDGRIVGQGGSPHFLGSLTVPVGAAPMGVATLAVRPEHLRVDASDGSPQAVVTLIEALGPETLVHLRFEGGDVGVARQSGAHHYEIGSKLHVAMDPRHALIFDGSGRLAWHGDL